MGRIRNPTGKRAAEEMMISAARAIPRLLNRRTMYLYPAPLNTAQCLQLVYTREQLAALHTLSPLPVINTERELYIRSETPRPFAVRLQSKVIHPRIYTYSETHRRWNDGLWIESLPDSYAREKLQTWMDSLRGEVDFAAEMSRRMYMAKDMCTTIPQLLALWPACEVLLKETAMYQEYLAAAPPKKARSPLPLECTTRDEKGRLVRMAPWTLEALAPFDQCLASLQMLPTVKPEVEFSIITR